MDITLIYCDAPVPIDLSTSSVVLIIVYTLEIPNGMYKHNVDMSTLIPWAILPVFTPLFLFYPFILSHDQ